MLCLHAWTRWIALLIDRPITDHHVSCISSVKLCKRASWHIMCLVTIAAVQAFTETSAITRVFAAGLEIMAHVIVPGRTCLCQAGNETAERVRDAKGSGRDFELSASQCICKSSRVVLDAHLTQHRRHLRSRVIGLHSIDLQVGSGTQS